jgi:hypothetical protein
MIHGVFCFVFVFCFLNVREWIIKRHREHRKQDTELRQSKQKTQHRQSKISNTYGHLQKPRVKLGVCKRLEVLFRMRSSRENTKKNNFGVELYVCNCYVFVFFLSEREFKFRVISTFNGIHKQEQELDLLFYVYVL